MSLNNVVPIDILLDIARSEGAYFQLSLPLYDAEYNIDEKYLTDIPIIYSWVNEDGSTGSTMGSCDHPSFAALRDNLEHNGYIKTMRNCVNGDTVLIPFTLNNHLFKVNERFYSAPAMKNIRRTI